MRVKLLCNIPSLGHKHGDKVDIPDDLAERLMGHGHALTLDDAEVIEKAEAEVKAEEDAKVAEKEAVEAKVAKSRSAPKAAADKAKPYDAMTRAQLVKEAERLEIDVSAKADKPTIKAAIKAKLDL